MSPTATYYNYKDLKKKKNKFKFVEYLIKCLNFFSRQQCNLLFLFSLVFLFFRKKETYLPHLIQDEYASGAIFTTLSAIFFDPDAHRPCSCQSSAYHCVQIFRRINRILQVNYDRERNKNKAFVNLVASKEWPSLKGLSLAGARLERRPSADGYESNDHTKKLSRP